MKTALLTIILIFSLRCIVAQVSAEEYLSMALDQHKQKEYEASLVLCTRAAELNTELVSAYFLRGYNNYLLEKYEDAIADFTITIQKDPNYFDAWYYRAKARQANGNLIGAMQDFNKARELSPSKTTFFMIRSTLASLFGQSDKKSKP